MLCYGYNIKLRLALTPCKIPNYNYEIIQKDGYGQIKRKW